MAGLRNSSSSMIDLKAELFRKQEEYKQLKAKASADFIKGRKNEKHGKEDIWSKKNSGVLERASRDMEQKKEEEDVMERSRKALEAKSRIYDKIASASGIPDEDGSEGYLVDFQKKAVDRIVEQRRGQGHGGKGQDTGDDSDHEPVNDEPVPPPSDPGEEWVDYVDSFGRSRRCMRKDLPHLEKQERPPGRSPDDSGLKLKEGATLLSADMKRELRRQQWEKEAEEAANGPVHYANVQFDEIRSHGTGFYQFSKDSNLRQEQMDMLNKLREQTTVNRQRSERIKEKRKAAIEARLAKVKQRRKMKEGSQLGTEEEGEVEKPAEDVTKEKLGQDQKEPEPLTRDDSWRASAPTREWDEGKEKLPEWNAKRYMEQRRNERENEFAPPQFYFDKQPTLPGHRPASSSQTNFKDQAKARPATQLSATNVNTDSMLKQIRSSVGASQASTSMDVDKKINQNRSDSGKAPADVVAGDINLAAIPLPQDNEPVHAMSSANTREADLLGTSESGSVDRMDSSAIYQNQAFKSDDGQQYFKGQGYPQPVSTYGPVPDVSVPPPGWYPAQPPAMSQQLPTAGSGPSCQVPATAVSVPAGPSAQSEESHVSTSSFIYPSQQGLLNPQSQQPRSKLQSDDINASLVTKPTVPKLSVVDKRFMQNKEVSDEDLLGYMAHSSADSLATVKPVAYTPGIFSSAAAGHKTSAEDQHNLALAHVAEEETTPTVSQQDASKQTLPMAQTEGVIFGVPDFLQPASDVVAETYQPGSFMAAKEAAAQRAEMEYEVARKKKQYSSAPVLYSRPDDSVYDQQNREDKRDSQKQEGTEEAGSEADDAVAKFLKEIRGGK